MRSWRLRNAKRATRFPKTQDSQMKRRLLLYSLSLGLSFGILIPFVSSTEALGFVLVLVTAAIVVASSGDLRALEHDKQLLLFILAVTAAVIAFCFSVPYEYDGYLFYGLIGLNVVVLAGYIVMRFSPRFAEME